MTSSAEPRRRVGSSQPSFSQQAFDVIAAIEALVVFEMELRDGPEMQTLAERPADEAGRAFQSLQRERALLLSSRAAEIYPGVAKVRADFDTGDGHEAQAGILEPLGEQAADLLVNLFGHTLDANALHCADILNG